MATEISAEGNVGNVKASTTQSGNLCLNVSIASQRRRMNRNTNEWENDGPVIWLAATFWNDEAQRLGDLLKAGDKVRVSGGLKMREYQASDGTSKQSLEIVNPVLWSHRPKQDRPAGGYTQGQPMGGPQNGTYATSEGSFDEPAPF